MISQDLHIHTTFSTGDSAVVPEQTVEFIAKINYAESIGISDHFEYITGDVFVKYEKTLRIFNFHVGTELDGAEWVESAAGYHFDYYIYHCKDRDDDYKAIEKLLSTGKPVIIAHPLHWGTNLNRVPPECLIEINNRYVWRNDWRSGFKKFIHRFKFVLGSDAHQPNWLNLNVARYVANELGVKETLLF